ncbi:unnamed protein product [Moneuplotes crassus]|uniref:Uncharacterized protein n=1 Tax=Euplotes crassus TaxID=5936 RepID=A0AAD1Y4Z7_EUPCR|nr:unnamed protein product [Moneuplotes crassus]
MFSNTPSRFIRPVDKSKSQLANTTLHKNIKNIESMIQDSRDYIKSCKQQKAELRHELAILEQKLKINVKEKVDISRNDQERLIQSLREQCEVEYHENIHLKAQISEMMKENNDLEKVIVDYESQIYKLELLIGLK